MYIFFLCLSVFQVTRVPAVCSLGSFILLALTFTTMIHFLYSVWRRVQSGSFTALGTSFLKKTILSPSTCISALVRNWFVINIKAYFGALNYTSLFCKSIFFTSVPLCFQLWNGSANFDLLLPECTGYTVSFAFLYQF